MRAHIDTQKCFEENLHAFSMKLSKDCTQIFCTSKKQVCAKTVQQKKVNTSTVYEFCTQRVTKILFQLGINRNSYPCTRL